MPSPTWKAIHLDGISKITEAKAIQSKADDDKRSVTDDEITKIDALLVAGKALKADAARRKVLEEIDTTPPNDPDIEAGLVRIPAVAIDHVKEGMGGFSHMGEFASSVSQFMSPSGRKDHRLLATMNQATSSEGGFLVPTTFATTIYDRFSGQADSLIARTDQYTLGSEEAIVFPADAETSRADGSRAGGVAGYWKAEQTQMASFSTPTVKEFRLEPQELYVFAKVTDKLLRNSPIALEQYLTRKASDEIAFKCGDAIVNGVGAGMPLGILVSPCLVPITKETGQLAATVVVENIVKMWARLHPKSKPNAVWLINGEVEQQLQVMTIGVGVGGVLVYMPPGGITAAPYGMIFGRPVLPVEYCAALGTKGDIILADLSAYATAVRGGVRADMSIHLLFDYAISCFRFQFEADGKPWLSSAITPYKATASATLSSFVTLNTRA